MMMPSRIEIRFIGNQIHYLYLAGAFSLVAVIKKPIFMLLISAAYLYLQYNDVKMTSSVITDMVVD